MRLGRKSHWGQRPVQSPWGWAPEAIVGRAPATALGLGPGNRWGQGHMRLPWGTTATNPLEARPVCRLGAGPQNPLGAQPRAIAVRLSPRSRWV